MNPFKNVATLVILVSVFVAGIWYAHAGISGPSGRSVPPISQIQTMSDLATLRVQITDSMIGENDHWEVHWLLHGEAVLGVDLSQARYSSVDEHTRKAVLSLPIPHVIASKVDHHRSKELTVRRKTWVPSPGRQSLRDEVWQHADEKIARIAADEGYQEATKLQVQHVLDNLFQDVGWNVSYQWDGSNVPYIEES